MYRCPYRKGVYLKGHGGDINGRKIKIQTEETNKIPVILRWQGETKRPLVTNELRNSFDSVQLLKTF